MGEISLKFRQECEDIEREHSNGIDLLLQAFELKASLLQGVLVVDQLPDRSFEVVQSPDLQSVTGPDPVRELIELWPRLKRA